MKKNLFLNFSVDEEKLQIKMTREFDANISLVWDAWTKSEILDQWWAPKPWKTQTQFMNFTEGGHWHFAMVGPEGEKHFGRIDYEKINPKTQFIAYDCFCDEKGNINPSLPKNKWISNFEEKDNLTTVNVITTYNSIEDLETIIKMGMIEGLTSALENLDLYIEKQFQLTSELKSDNSPRVTTYLNFPGNTEEAFLFYKSVFKSDFSGKGIQRFGDIPKDSGHPPVPESIKKMILHVELPTIGNHILMGTDAPKEMGFNLISGNNMHICLEPSSREETERIFNELSEGGEVTMPLEDMFFGAYFGEFKDKFGINWMLNFKNVD